MRAFDYWRKQSKKQPLYADALWNIPEQRQGRVAVVGGNSQGFAAALRTAEFLERTSVLTEVRLVLPDSLKSLLPPLEHAVFAPSTNAGSFEKSPVFARACIDADATLMIGDFSHNAATTVALEEVVARKESMASVVSGGGTNTKSLIMARDTVDSLLAVANNFIARPDLMLVVSALQLQKLVRVLYYPRPVMLSQPLATMVETLHKFTLSYPCTVVTYHDDQIVVARGGEIVTTPIVDTEYTPLNLWNGQLAARIALVQVFNPGRFLESTVAAVLYN